jgi:hypothetical protein
VAGASIDSAIDRSPAPSSSNSSAPVIAERSIAAPLYFSGIAATASPSSQACSRKPSGSLAASSASWAFGAITFRAKSRAVSMIICCSSVGSNAYIASPSAC